MSISDLADDCEANGGVLAVSLGDLRDAVDAGKLGKLVVHRIARDLEAHGLGYFPRHLLDGNDQPRQDQEVRIYRKGNATTARAIDAVLSPSARGDDFLTSLAGNDARDTLDRIREIVCAE